MIFYFILPYWPSISLLINIHTVHKQNNKIIELILPCTSFCYYCNHAHSQKTRPTKSLPRSKAPTIAAILKVQSPSLLFCHLSHGRPIWLRAMRICFRKCDLLLFAPSLGARCLLPTHHHWAVATFKFDLINLRAQLKSSPPTTIN